MSRLRFFSIRLAASAVPLLLAFSVIRGLWYPGAYFAAAGTSKFFLILAVSAVIVGPVLSTAMFRPGKWGLKFDLVALSLAEVAVVVAGVAVLYLRQPGYTVFAVDRFEIVTQRDVDSREAEAAGIRPRPGHTPRLVYAELPANPDALSRLVEETMFEGKADIDRRPEFWQPYPRGVAAIKAAATPLSELLAAGDRRAGYVRRWLNFSAYEAGQLAYLPLRGRARDVTMILHTATGYPVATLAIDPW